MRPLQAPVPIEKLILDPLNPRLPEEVQSSSQAEILAYLYANDVLDELVDSYLTNGFFPNEQLLVLPEDASGCRIVVEGNRRLAALKYLMHDETAQAAEVPEFLTDPEPNIELLRQLQTAPVVELADRKEAAAYLGFRHINGLKTWSPEAKARYIYSEVKHAVENGDDRPFYSVGRAVGSHAAGVRNAFVAYDTLRYARDELDLRQDATWVLENRFSVWARLLGTSYVPKLLQLRQRVTTYDEVVRSTRGMDRDAAQEVLSDLVPGSDGGQAVLDDSRDVTRYSDVLGNPEAHKILRAYKRLDLAIDYAQKATIDDRLNEINKRVAACVQEVIDGVILSRNTLEIANTILKNSRSLSALVSTHVDGSDGIDLGD